MLKQAAMVQLVGERVVVSAMRTHPSNLALQFEAVACLAGTLHTPHSTPYTLCPASWPLQRTTYTLHPTPNTLHPTPYNLHPTPYTLHPTPCTLHPAPYTIHPTRYTLHPTPYTLHPTPEPLAHKLPPSPLGPSWGSLQRDA